MVVASFFFFFWILYFQPIPLPLPWSRNSPPLTNIISSLLPTLSNDTTDRMAGLKSEFEPVSLLEALPWLQEEVLAPSQSSFSLPGSGLCPALQLHFLQPPDMCLFFRALECFSISSISCCIIFLKFWFIHTYIKCTKWIKASSLGFSSFFFSFVLLSFSHIPFPPPNFQLLL